MLQTVFFKFVLEFAIIYGSKKFVFWELNINRNVICQNVFT